jgi:hypothetical protein
VREDDPDRVARELALDLMRRATIDRLKADAVELAELLREVPVPVLPSDPNEARFALQVWILRERDHFRRLRDTIIGCNDYPV